MHLNIIYKDYRRKSIKSDFNHINTEEFRGMIPNLYNGWLYNIYMGSYKITVVTWINITKSIVNFDAKCYFTNAECLVSVWTGSSAIDIIGMIFEPVLNLIWSRISEMFKK